VPDSQRTTPWHIILLFLVVVAGGALAWWGATGSSRAQIEVGAACTQCGYAGKIMVGPTPSSEPWPRECPKCHQKHYYFAQRCPACGKLIPMKDPEADKFGSPRSCPWCKSRALNT